MASIITFKLLYVVIGIILWIIAGFTFFDKTNKKRYTTALFWGLFGFPFILGDVAVGFLGQALAYKIIGAMVILLALIGGFNSLGLGNYNEPSQQVKNASAIRLGHKLFLPAILIPVITVFAVFFLADISFANLRLIDANTKTIGSLFIAVLVAMLVAWYITKDSPISAVKEARRLIDTVGWAMVLPQFLAMLGGIFVFSKTGDSIKYIIELMVNPNNVFMLVVIYCVGMALFTMIMGNAFAAFPVLTAGIGLPLLMLQHGGNPAVITAIGMYAGYCGTLMTPMAANFNIVPAALLELKDKYQVIKVQVATALCLLAANIILMYIFMGV